MANRTFKVYGQAYASAGDVTAVLTVGGVEVFNGAVNDSTTVRDGQPTINNHLFSFTLDEATTGNLAYSLTATGGELCLGQTQYNGAKIAKLSDEWVASNIPDVTAVSTAAQTHIATELGETALGTDLYNALVAGTVTNPSDAQNATLAEAVMQTDWTTYVTSNDVRANGQIDGVAMVDWEDDAVNTGNWPILEDGQVFTCTWNHTPDTYSTVV
jgi:hypothetical protein